MPYTPAIGPKTLIGVAAPSLGMWWHTWLADDGANWVADIIEDLDDQGVRYEVLFEVRGDAEALEAALDEIVFGGDRAVIAAEAFADRVRSVH